MRLPLSLRSLCLAPACALALAVPAYAGQPAPGAAPDPANVPLPAEGDVRPTDPGQLPADKPAAAPAPAAEEAPPAAPGSAVGNAPAVGNVVEDAYGISDDAVPPGSRLDWAARREIRVIQKRAMLKEGRHGISIFTGVVPNDDFFTYVALGLGYRYYFSEDFALHIRGTYTPPVKTGLQPLLEKSRADEPPGLGLIVRLPQTLLGYGLAGVDWNLLHGKLGFFSTRLIEFDFALNFGVGMVLTQIIDQGKESQPVNVFDPAGNVGATLQIYLSDRFALGLDYTQLFYPKLRDIFAQVPPGQSSAHPGAGGVSHPLAATVTLTWFTAGLD